MTIFQSIIRIINWMMIVDVKLAYIVWYSICVYSLIFYLSLTCFLNVLAKCSNLSYHQPKNGLFCDMRRTRDGKLETACDLLQLSRGHLCAQSYNGICKVSEDLFLMMGICGDLLIDWFIMKMYCIYTPKTISFLTNQVGVRNDCRFSLLCHL